MADEIERPDLLPYASEKLADAVWVLATHPGNVKSRLRSAAEHLAMVHPSGLPVHLRDEYESIWYELTKRASSEPGVSALAATSRGMRLATGAKLAQRILLLRSQVDFLCR